jgi:hypothetical protein
MMEIVTWNEKGVKWKSNKLRRKVKIRGQKEEGNKKVYFFRIQVRGERRSEGVQRCNEVIWEGKWGDG